MTYLDKLKDPRWQKKRLEILEAAGWACEDCGSNGRTLHVHHKRYRKHADPWEYDRKELLALCEQCHKDVTLLLDDINKLLSEMSIAKLVSAYNQVKQGENRVTFYCRQDKVSNDDLTMFNKVLHKIQPKEPVTLCLVDEHGDETKLDLNWW